MITIIQKLSDAQCVAYYMSIDGSRVYPPELAEFWKCLSIEERREYGNYCRAQLQPQPM